METRPLYRVGAAGLDPRDWRLIEIVFKHSQYNRYEFVLVADVNPTSIDVLIVNTVDPAGVRAVSMIRNSGRDLPIVVAVPRGAPSSARYAISIDRLTLQLLPILNRVVDTELLNPDTRPAQTGSAGGPSAPIATAWVNGPPQSLQPPAPLPGAVASAALSRAPSQSTPPPPTSPLSPATASSAATPAASGGNAAASPPATGTAAPTVPLMGLRVPSAANPAVAASATSPAPSTAASPANSSNPPAGVKTGGGAPPITPPDTFSQLVAKVVPKATPATDPASPAPSSPVEQTGTSRTGMAAPPRPNVGAEHGPPVSTWRPSPGATYAGSTQGSGSARLERASPADPPAGAKAAAGSPMSPARGAPPGGAANPPSSGSAAQAANRLLGRPSAGAPDAAWDVNRTAPAADPFSTRSNLVAFPSGSVVQPPAPPRLQVLIVDDSPTVRQQLTLALERMGMRCVAVDSAALALQRLSVQHFDLVLADVVMPDMDGYKLTREIKRNKSTRQIPVIILTSKSSPFDLARGALAGCDSYLSKPVPLRALETAIVKQLRKKMAIDDLTALIRTGDAPPTSRTAPAPAGTKPGSLTPPSGSPPPPRNASRW